MTKKYNVSRQVRRLGEPYFDWKTLLGIEAESITEAVHKADTELTAQGFQIAYGMGYLCSDNGEEEK